MAGVELGKDQFGIDLLKSLGIPSIGVRKLVLTVEVNDIVRVEIEKNVYKDEARRIRGIMKENYVFDVIERSER